MTPTAQRALQPECDRPMLHWVVPVLTLAAAYGVAGRLGLLLALPPGYTTPLWPASGLALAAVLMGGTRLWPGIWLGSFLVNIGITFDATSAAALLTSIAIPAGIGVGAVVQAYVGSSLVRRYGGFPKTLTRAGEIAALLILGGPVSCLISASVGVGVLAISGRIPQGMYFIHWGTWWLGDTFGILVTMPLALIWLAEPRALWRRRRLTVTLPHIGALALVVVVFFYVWSQERERLSLLFERQAETLTHTIQTRLDDYLKVLLSLESFYTSVPETSEQAYYTFVQKLLARHPGLRTLAWNLRLPAGQGEMSMPSTERQPSSNLQVEGHNPLEKPTQPPQETSVAYIEPHVWNKPALGLDVASILSFREALEQASKTGLPAVTGRLTLEQEADRQFGLLVFLPVYSPELPTTTEEERQQNLRGYMTGVFRIGDIVEASLQHLEREGIVLWIEDELAPADQRMLYHSQWHAMERANISPDGEPRGTSVGTHWKTTVELAGRPLGLHFASTPEYLAARQSLLPWGALSGGLAFVSLLGGFLIIMTVRSIVIEQLMVERTTQLETSRRLEATAEQRRHIAESLAEVVRVLSQSLDPQEVGQRVVAHVQTILQARVAALYQLEPTSGMLIVLAARDHFGPAAVSALSFPAGLGAAELAVERHQPVISADILADPRMTLSASIRADIESTPVRAVLALPLLRDGLVIGALSIGDVSGRSFDAEAVELARLFADQASTALANAQLYAEVQAAHERLQGLSRQLLEAQEVERRRIAHELHDEAGQLLAFVHLALELAVTKLPPPLQECFQPVRDHLDAIEAQLRHLSHELRPTILDDLGLLPALQFLADGVAARTGLRIRVGSAIEGRLEPHVETALYRIMQEGLTNITKHAAAGHVQLQLWRDDGMVYGRLQDDGVGFAVDQVMSLKGSRGLGLIGMQERLGALGGSLQVTSAPGQGTTLHIAVPAEPWMTSSEADRAWADTSSPVSAGPDGSRGGDAAAMISSPSNQESPHAC